MTPAQTDTKAGTPSQDAMRAAILSSFQDVRVHYPRVDTVRIYPTPRRCELRFQGRLVGTADAEMDAIIRGTFNSSAAHATKVERERIVSLCAAEMKYQGFGEGPSIIRALIDRITKGT